MTELSRSKKIIERVFFAHHEEGARQVTFRRQDIEEAARELGLEVPKNLGDIVYSFRYRTQLPESIQRCAPEGEEWIIRPSGTARYSFVPARLAAIRASTNLAKTKIPDATPGIIAKYALNDEQALLARLRYNRLLDIFTRVACYSLQNHLRTTVPGMGQVETDEIYIGVDRRGAQYVCPVEAKGHSDKLSVVQIEQDIAVCRHKFPALICRPIAAQFMDDETIALFELGDTEEGLRVYLEKHYQLVPPDKISPEDLQAYAMMPQDDS